MNKHLIILSLCLFVLTGCGSAPKMDKLSKLEEKIATLEAENESLKEIPDKENTKECPNGFASSLDKTQCINIPENAHIANNGTDVWLCDAKFKEIGDSCLPKTDLVTQTPPQKTSQRPQKIDPMVQIKPIGECIQLTDGDVEDFFSCEFDITFNHPTAIYEVDFNEASVFYEYALRKTKESPAVSQVEDITNYAFFSGKAGETNKGKVLFPLPDELKAPLTFRFAIKQAGEIVKYLVVK